MPYFIVLLCLTQDDFTHRGESAGTLVQWVNIPDEYSFLQVLSRQLLLG
jgi:hypothetical protein